MSHKTTTEDADQSAVVIQDLRMEQTYLLRRMDLGWVVCETSWLPPAYSHMAWTPVITQLLDRIEDLEKRVERIAL